jgi:hypothetical protein
MDVFAGKEMTGFEVHAPKSEEPVSGDQIDDFGVSDADMVAGLLFLFDGGLFKTKWHGFPPGSEVVALVLF